MIEISSAIVQVHFQGSRLRPDQTTTG